MIKVSENLEDLNKLQEKYKRLVECFPKEDLYRTYYRKLSLDILRIKKEQKISNLNMN